MLVALKPSTKSLLTYKTQGFKKFSTMAEDSLVKEFISKNKVAIFSKTYCPYCEKVKKLFKGLQVPFEVIELDTRPDGEKILDILRTKTGARTVPRVFIKGNFVGGCDDTMSLHNQGKLKSLLD